MPVQIVIPATSAIHTPLMEWTQRRRMLFLAGLPGVGKTLLMQQCALMARAQGRSVTLLQWDVARGPYETPEILARYPEHQGATHPAIRKAAGLWARGAVLGWHLQNPAPRHLLLAELPIVGNRLVELVQRQDDAAEAVLGDASAVFVLPVPSRAVRAGIEAARQRSIAQPAHAREAADAPPNVLQALWHELHALSGEPAAGNTAIPYSPDVYANTYLRLLRHRHAARLDVTETFATAGSPYELGEAPAELTPTSCEVSDSLAQVEQKYTPDALVRAVADWWRI